MLRPSDYMQGYNIAKIFQNRKPPPRKSPHSRPEKPPNSPKHPLKGPSDGQTPTSAISPSHLPSHRFYPDPTSMPQPPKNKPTATPGIHPTHAKSRQSLARNRTSATPRGGCRCCRRHAHDLKIGGASKERIRMQRDTGFGHGSQYRVPEAGTNIISGSSGRSDPFYPLSRRY